MAGKKTKNSSKRLKAEDLATQQREISVSEFFSKNRHLLGFDNPKRALLTTVKEAVDNSLDACEEAGIMPEIYVEIAQIEGREDRFMIKVGDNGPGIVKEQVGRIFGKLLYGSKFHRLKMNRGQQGIGISAAGMYGQLTTGKPVVILSKTRAEGPAEYMEVVLDTRMNEPKITKESQISWNGHAGTEVRIELEGHYQRGKWSPDAYLRQTAMANPHVNIHYKDPDGKEKTYKRAIEVLPKEPKAIKPHPHGIELGMLINMLHQTDSKKLKSCLQNDFCRVSSNVALKICKKAGVYENARPRRIARQEAENLLNAIKDTKLMNPPLDCIAPIGEERILEGLKNNLDAEFYDAVTRKPSVYRGNPFLIEAAVAYGGKLPPERSAKLMRFANRVPLLYQSGACVMTQSVQSMNWKLYKIDQPQGAMPVGPMLILLHMASPWVPFTSESKEAVASYPEVEKEITLALQDIGRKLRIFRNKQNKSKEESRKRKYIERYIPHIGQALQDILAFPDQQRDQLTEKLTCTLENSRMKSDQP